MGAGLAIQPHAATERCPWCGNAVTRARFLEIEEKIAERFSRQQQRNTADDLGEGAEVDAYEALRDAFKRDDIARIKRGQPGADIRHRALHTGSGCGTIMIDSKNRQGWLSSYVTKLREDQVTEKAEHTILATTIFPSTSQT